MKPSLNNTFCWLPFEHLALKSFENGRVARVAQCCNAMNYDADPMKLLSIFEAGGSLRDAFKAPQMDELRAALLRGERHPSCNVCWEREDKTNNSPRLGYRSVRGGMESGPDLVSIDTMLDEQCNMRCRMCNTYNSNLLRKDAIALSELGLATTYIRPTTHAPEDVVHAISDALLAEILTLDLRHIKMTGGEPLISPRFWTVVDTLISSGRSGDVELSITTNGSKFNDRFLTVLPFFRRVDLTVSVDGFERSYDYVRYPFTWGRLDANVRRLLGANLPNVHLRLDTVVLVYNVLDLGRLFAWSRRLGLNHNVMVKPRPYDTCLDVRWLPDDILREALSRLSVEDVSTAANYLSHCLANPPEPEPRARKISELVRDTNALDRVRSQSFVDHVDPLLVPILTGR